MSAAAPGAAVRLRADPGLRPVQDSAGGQWRSSGERACFALSGHDLGARLPAGWYRLDGWLALEDDIAAVPCLYPRYDRGADGDPQIPLPEPDGDGRISALVLFKYDVEALRFCPVQVPASFRVSGFSLQRVSRARALVRMLAPTPRAPGGVPRRAAVFVAAALRDGVSPATDALYRDYRRRLLPEEGDYAAWVARHDTLTAERMIELRARAERLGDAAPLLSILLPTYQTPERWLRRCIESVLAQAYPRWELCIADDASPDPRVVEVARGYAARDPRIRVERREANGHISEASNTALAMARGDFVALLDHDDELRPHALLEVAEAIVAAPDVELVYSDEDKLDAEGRRFDPYFKPDFDPDLLRGQNYVCHFTAIRAELVRAVGGFRQGFEGSQDHDLVLRCTERLRPAQVRHVPKVLYHWRAIPGSTALSRDAKDYASSAGARAVGEHLARMHPGAGVEELSHGHFRVRWPLPSPPPKVSLIVPTRDRVELLRTCIESIVEQSTYPAFEVVVVDNQSSDPAALDYLRTLEGRERVRVLRYDAPFNYSAINNWAVGQCRGDVVGLVNNDIEVITPDWLEEMVSQAMRPEVGAVGAMLYYPDDTIQHAGVVLGVHGVAAHLYTGMPRGYPGHGGRARVAQSLSAVTGACLLVRRDAYEQVSGLDESLQVAFNDIDFCLRLREAGYRNVWTPFAELYHHESASRGSEDTEEKKQRFAREVELMQRRWGEQLPCDPAYNPNLSLRSFTCELAIPPR
ncbi:MAG TPA: glycosyltransferase family 2 protein [Luteimonas sp.]|nr:glycosyltransferase family 2 protein [Luteimonas sp.]